MMDVESYIKSKGWKYKPAGTDQFVVKVCPFCKANDFHFYINKDTGQYYCHHVDCNQAGGIYTLKNYLGDTMRVANAGDMVSDDEHKKQVTLTDVDIAIVHKAYDDLWCNAHTLRYLSKRKFTKEAIEHFHLGVIEDKRGQWLMYPYFENGIIKNVKLRTIPPAPKAFRRFVGGESILYNFDVTREHYDTIFLTEGEADCVALWSAGFKNVVSVPDGAKSGSNIIDALDRYGRVYIVPDTDEAGQEGLPKLARRLGYERTYHIRLPTGIKDVNEYLKSHTASEFQALINAAEKIDVEDVKPVSGVVQDIIVSLYSNTSTSQQGLHWPWKRVEDRLGGPMQPGDLYVVGGRPGVGKSYFAINVMMSLAKTGHPSLLFELEMRPERLTPRIVSHHLHVPTEAVNNIEMMTKAYNELKGIPFYFAYKWKQPSWQVVEDTTKMCIRRYNLEFMVFDNLHFLCRKENRVEEVSIMIQNFKNLAVECGIPVLVIARPRKTLKKIIDSEDLAWTADIHGDADSIILIHRDKISNIQSDIPTIDATYSPRAQIILDKARWGRGGNCFLNARDDIATFEDVEG